MNFTKTTTLLILLFFLFVLSFTLFYGTYRRIYSPTRIIKCVHYIEEINSLWKETGVKGRILVIFARHIKPDFRGSYFGEYLFTNLAIHQGTIRTIYHVIPKKYWPEAIYEKTAIRPDIISDDKKLILANNKGRKYFMVLDEFHGLSEQTLVIIDIDSWSTKELHQINNLLNNGNITTDILTYFGTPPSSMNQLH